MKNLWYNGEIWMRGSKKIVAYPQTRLYRILDSLDDYCEEIEDIVDSLVFED